MRKVLSVSDGPQPFPDIPIKGSAQPQQPGEELIRYEVEAAEGCQLNCMGWCCFGILALTALPFSWIPCVCTRCKRKEQRPVYGYPVQMQGLSLKAAANANAVADTDKPSMQPAAVAAPTVHCMDVSLEKQLTVSQLDQQQQQHAAVQQQGPQTAQQQAADQLGARLQQPRTPSPPPISIFVPPSAVPPGGFTADNPFPCRFSSQQHYLRSRGSPLPASPRAAAAANALVPITMTAAAAAAQLSSPRHITHAGLPVLGMPGT